MAEHETITTDESLHCVVVTPEETAIDTTARAPMPRSVHAALAQLRDFGAPGVPDEVLARALLVWTGLFGAISYELFGHLHGLIEDFDVFFDHQVKRWGAYLAGEHP